MRRTMVAVITIAALGACSDSTSPAPSFLGTWHVRITSFSPDTIQPNPFTITLSAGQGDTLHVAMAPVEWDHPPNYVFDSAYTTVIPRADSVTFIERDEAEEYLLVLIGAATVKRDTMTGQVGVVNSALQPIGLGAFIATKP